MTFREWRQWVRGLKWSSKWFIILILLRPFIDNFYYLKEVSPFLSPLYIVGVATPVLALYAIISLPKTNYSRLDNYFLLFSVFTVIACGALLISGSFSMDSFDFTLKFLFVPLVYFFCRRLIRSKHDLHAVFQTFIYSSVFILAVFSYELVVNPINVQISRGFERYHGSFADIMSYSIYMTSSLLILSYSFIDKTNTIPLRKRLVLLLIAVMFSVLMLFNIHHTASYIVVTVLILLFLFHNLRANISIGIVALLVVGSVIYVSGTDTFTKKILPLIETDISVYEGEKGDEALLHGRMGRWMNFYEHFSSQGFMIQMMGLPLTMESPYIYIGKGSHNDFVRTTMLMGYVGLIVYLLLLFNIFRRITRYDVAPHFLGLGMLAIICLYSFTTTPLLYPSLLYVALPFFAMLALPREFMK